MKKILILMCVLGVILPYYHLINFLIINNGSMDGFWSEIFSSHPVSMISMDLTVAATTFLIFLIYKKQKDKIKAKRFVQRGCGLCNMAAAPITRTHVQNLKFLTSRLRK